MKFKVQCTFRETVFLDGLLVDSVGFTVEAPSKSIAEQKVKSFYPDISDCVVESINNQSKQYLVIFILDLCICLFVYFIFKPYKNDLTSLPGIFEALLNAGGWFMGALTVFGALLGVVYFILESIFKQKIDVHSTEKEYSYRLGYKDGWTECEHKLEPRFIYWAQQDGEDIEPKLGPAKRMSS